MSRPIQAQNPGFLGLLGLKNNGQNPAEMIDAVAPTIDIRENYLLGLRETILDDGVSRNLNAAGVVLGWPEFDVPGNEVWYVHDFTIIVDVAVGGVWIGKALHLERGTQYVHAGDKSGDVFANAQGGIFLAQVGGFYALPGDMFAALTEQVVSPPGVPGAGARIVISRFPV